MNLVVIARRPELAERCAATIQALTGRHPSRTIVVQSADPDGPSWLDARVEAHCVLPRDGRARDLRRDDPCHRRRRGRPAPRRDRDAAASSTTCRSRSGGRASRRSDRPATRTCWPARTGSSWTARPGAATGSIGSREMAGLLDTTPLAISDFALVRQSRWREAIASIFDDPDFLPYLRSLRRIAVTYGTHDETGAPGSTNLVKPLYHVGWLASRLGLRVVKPCRRSRGAGASATASRPAAGAPVAKPVSAEGSGPRCRTAARRSAWWSVRWSRPCRPGRRCASSFRARKWLP